MVPERGREKENMWESEERKNLREREREVGGGGRMVMRQWSVRVKESGEREKR